jgi:hypothetical protein
LRDRGLIAAAISHLWEKYLEHSIRYSGRLAILFAAALAMHAGTIVVPGNYESTPGAGGGNTYPFSQEKLRYQQILPGSAIAGPLLLNGIAFRASPVFTLPAEALIDMRIDLSITAITPETLDTTFAANAGPVVTTVFLDIKHAQISGSINPDGTTPFDLFFPFLSNFAFDPAQGNLLLDIRIGANPNGTNISGRDVFITGSIFPARVYGAIDQSTGAIDNTALIAQLSFDDGTPPATAVPEPATILLTFLVLVIVPLYRRR